MWTALLATVAALPTTSQAQQWRGRAPARDVQPQQARAAAETTASAPDQRGDARPWHGAALGTASPASGATREGVTGVDISPPRQSDHSRRDRTPEAAQPVTGIAAGDARRAASPSRPENVIAADRRAGNRRALTRRSAERLERARQWARAWADRRDFARDRAGFYDRRDWASRDWGERGWREEWPGSSGAAGAVGWSREWRREERFDWSSYRSANRNAFHLPRYYAPYGWNGSYRRFPIGGRLAPLLFTQSYWIADPYSYRLPEPYGPYRWIRFYNDALLVDVETGEVADMIYDIFW